MFSLINYFDGLDKIVWKQGLSFVGFIKGSIDVADELDKLAQNAAVSALPISGILEEMPSSLPSPPCNFSMPPSTEPKADLVLSSAERMIFVFWSAIALIDYL